MAALSPDLTRVLFEVIFFRHLPIAVSLQLFVHAKNYSPAGAGRCRRRISKGFTGLGEDAQDDFRRK
jgi:hypothetical protein